MSVELMQYLNKRCDKVYGQQPKPVAATPPPIGSTPQSPGNQSLQSSKSSGSTAMDLLGDLGGDPFASSTPAHPQGGFADFGNFGSATSQPPAFAQSSPLQPAGSNIPASQPAAFNGFGAPPSSVAAPSAGGDKYSNLSDLFSMGNEEAESSAPKGWSSTVNTVSSGGINWNSSSTNTSSTGINWGGESNSSSTAGGVGWNSSPMPGTSSVGMSWGGTSTAASWGVPATAQSNVSNPFGGSSNTALTSQSSVGMGHGGQPVANPFGGQPQMGHQPAGFGAFGTPQSTASQGGFGQFGAPNTAVSSGAGYGQMGMQNGGFGMPPTTATAGFGQGGFGGAQQGFGQQPQQGAGFGGFGAQQGFGAQHGGFGAQPSGGFGGQQMQGFGQQPQQQAGGWGQPVSSVNPFMSTATQQQYSAPKSGATNPFL